MLLLNILKNHSLLHRLGVESTFVIGSEKLFVVDFLGVDGFLDLLNKPVLLLGVVDLVLGLGAVVLGVDGFGVDGLGVDGFGVDGLGVETFGDDTFGDEMCGLGVEILGVEILGETLTLVYACASLAPANGNVVSVQMIISDFAILFFFNLLISYFVILR